MAGQVEGMACGEEPESVPEMAMAKEELKFKAAKLQATVVTAYNQEIFELDKAELSEIIDEVVLPYP